MIALRLQRWTGVVVLLVGACASFRGEALQYQPKAADHYSTEASPGGVLGGGPADEVADILEEVLEERGDKAYSDGALGAAAVTMLRDAAAGRAMNESSTEEAVRRFGFAGEIRALTVQTLNGKLKETLRSQLATFPHDTLVTRYGVAADTRVHAVAILLGSMEASLEQFPRAISDKGTLHLHGELAERFQQAAVFVTSSTGTVRKFPIPSRKIDLDVRFDGPGTHKLELLAQGNRGPEVLMNVPIRVGNLETRSLGIMPAAAPAATPEKAEERIFALINAARTAAGVSPLVVDPELRAVALAHSLDMVQHNFHGHMSPTTGMVENRLQRAGIHTVVGGENIARSSSPERVHEDLMGSPGHRAAILEPSFTHVGIGIVFTKALDQSTLVTTEVFARRPPPEAARQSPEAVLQAVQGYRAAHRIPLLRVDRGLWNAAMAGVNVFSPSDPASGGRATQTVLAFVQAEVNRTRRNRSALCVSAHEILELAQLAQGPIAVNPALVNLGIGVRVIEERGRPLLLAVLVAEGSPGVPIKCE